LRCTPVLNDGVKFGRCAHLHVADLRVEPFGAQVEVVIDRHPDRFVDSQRQGGRRGLGRLSRRGCREGQRRKGKKNSITHECTYVV
jgi:hypothetical protein